MRRRAFTLVELMVAMAVLIIMLGFMMQFIWRSQSLQSAAQENARIYESIQVFFDVLQRDLEACKTSNVPGGKIWFRLGKEARIGSPNVYDAADPNQLSFVSVQDATAAQTTGVCEVHYSFRPDTWEIRRATVTDTDTTNWDFYSPPDSTWATTDGSSYPILEGVAMFQVWVQFPGDTTFTHVDATPISRDRRPSAIRVRVVLVDPEVYAKFVAPIADGGMGLSPTHPKVVQLIQNSRRSFSKTMAICQ